MNRRELLKRAALSAAALSLGPRLLRRPARAEPPTSFQRTLMNISLDGGPDLRHLIVPPYDEDPASYGYAYWSSRRRAHAIGADKAAWRRRWEDDYLPVELGGVRFGVLAKAGWLKGEIEAGRVAIVSNTLGSSSRNHSQATLAWESGAPDVDANDLNRDGWGGRLAAALDARVVSMTGAVRLFCNGPHPSDPHDHDNGRVLSAQDTREIALYHAPELAEDPSSTGARQVMSRGLRAYYAAKAAELPAGSPFRSAIEHERAFRALGAQVEARLATVPLPPALEALYEGDGRLSERGLGRQLRNAYDSLACADIFDLRVGSLSVEGWDTHRDQAARIEPMFADLFGQGRGLATFFDEARALMPEAAAKTTFVIGGEFGRQLHDNGDGGTDHGRGNTVLVIGEQVRGGLYGELFPASEIPRYRDPGADIEGLTSIEALFSALCDWMEPGAGDTVFPNRAAAAVEEGVDLARLMSS